MADPTHLWLYFLVVLAVVVLPGLDMACVLASALVGGRRAGMAAVAGILAGATCHLIVGATGVAVLLKVIPGAFNALLLAGAFYIAWIGATLLRGGAGPGALVAGAPTTPVAAFRRGALTNLLNPKAYLFMLAVFPQFIRPAWGSIPAQAAVLWAITLLTQLAVYGLLALAAGSVRPWLTARPATAALAGRVVGAVLLATAVWTGVEGWRGL